MIHGGVSGMTFRERTLAIFAHKPVDNIVYQPRIEHWYWVNLNAGTLPARYRGMSLLDVYDDLGCSIRSYPFFNGCLKVKEDPSVKYKVEEYGDITVSRWTTPVGSIEMRSRRTALAHHTEKFPVEKPEDARVMEYILRGRTWWFDYEEFERNDKLIGERAAPMIFIPRINIQRLYIEIMGVENTIFALNDDRRMVEHLIQVINETDEQMLKVVAESPIPIINFGDNIDHHFLPPNLYKRYVEPEYKRRAKYLRSKGKFTHAHWDGHIKLLLPYAKDTGLDGIEALTPMPQGDITIDEMKEALGDMILLDGIPMTWFLPHERVEDLESVTREIIEKFKPNLILGISDEPSPVCDIERVRLVSEIVKTYEER
ncbi:MAG: uroporphyrinogen decarboxylase family protein [Armatimonadota bacterium]|nr:uroporphyrinogen decarboxylase family protein [Armatimonadota bacterium]